jgi:hypothetical protein
VGIDQIKTWSRAHVPELIALGVGVLLRLSMALSYDARIGYDFNAHWPHIQYIATQHAMPPLTFNAHPIRFPSISRSSTPGASMRTKVICRVLSPVF